MFEWFCRCRRRWHRLTLLIRQVTYMFQINLMQAYPAEDQTGTILDPVDEAPPFESI